MVRRGQLKVFLGAAPGVGKTYAMLEEGHRLRAEGRDVVIGFVEPHGRREIKALMGDLEIVPPRTIQNRDSTLEELDLEAVLTRRPQVALVDDLAHSKGPESSQEKRWQDVEEILDAGIDVLSTVNIQHLESLNDVIFEITDVAQTETIPDEVVRRADEIELVDLTEAAVRDRLAAGKIYPAERVDAVLANYFRPGNLGALRKLALSWTADRVEEALEKYRDLHGIEERWETRERVIVAIAGAEGGDAVIRRAARLAMRSRADLVGVYVRPTQGRAEEIDRSLPSQRELLEQFGGGYHETVGDDVGAALLSFAQEEEATQIVLGASRRSRFDEIVRGSPIARVIRNAGAIDVHVVSYDGGRQRRWRLSPPRRWPISWLRRGIAWGIALVGIPGLTWILLQVRGEVSLHNVLLMYLLAAVGTGAIGGVLPAVTTALAGFLLANWYFTPPVETWTIGNPGDLFSLIAFLVVSVAVGLLVGYSGRRNGEARKARAQAEALAATTALRYPVFGADQTDLLRRIRIALSLQAISMLRRTDEGWETLAWEGSRQLSTPEAGSETIELAGELALVILDGKLTTSDRIVLRAFVAQIILAVERAALEKEAETAESMAETDRLRTALLGAVSHDLRTPLATIKASLTSLVETGVDWTPDETRGFLNTALDETERLNRLVGHLLDASRVQAGAVHVFYRSVGVEEVVASALSGLKAGRDRIVVDISESLPEIQTDPDLLERAIANLVENALKWSPPHLPIRITAGKVGGRIDLRITDRGPGIPRDAREAVFQPFQRMSDSPQSGGFGLGLAVARGLLEAMGNDLHIEDTPGGGTTMLISLKIAGSLAARAQSSLGVSHG